MRLVQSEVSQVDVALRFQSLLGHEDVIQKIHAGRLRMTMFCSWLFNNSLIGFQLLNWIKTPKKCAHFAPCSNA